MQKRLIRKRKLSVLMPVYNEEHNIETILNRVVRAKIGEELELIIVDDCSNDKTLEKVEKLRSKLNLNIKVIKHENNVGKGGAVRTAIKNMTGDLAIIQDADLEYDPADIVSLIERYDNEKKIVVYGSRSLNKKNKYSYISYQLGNVFLNVLTNILYGVNLTDMETCYKLIPSNLLREINLVSNKFDMEPEITAKVIKKGYKIKEVPISYNPRSKEEGKKIKWIDGVSAIKTLVYWKFKRI